MPVLRAVVVLEVDGTPLPGFPVARRITVSEGQAFDFIKAIGGATALPVDQISAALNALVVRPDGQVTITTQQIKVNAGGFLLAFDVDLGVGAQATVANATAGNVQVKGYGGGS